MIRVLCSACAAALLLAAPAQAQKFLSATGETTRTTFGASVQPTPAPEAPAAETPVAEAGTEVAEAGAAAAEPTEEEIAARFVNTEPDTVGSGDFIETFEPDDGECGAGSLWNPETAVCETF